MDAAAEETGEVGGRTQTRSLADVVAGVRFALASPSVQRAVRLLLLDGIGCGVSAAKRPWARKAAQALAQEDVGIHGEELWTWERRVHPATAVLLNGSFVQGSELDDYNEFSPVHASSVVVPPALASCPRNESAETFLDSLLAGYEVAARVGLAMGGAAVVADGWHSGGVFGPLAAAAAAGRAMKLSGERMEHAIGMAATQAGGLMSAQYGGDVKRIHHGFAARNGFIAAKLAAGGVDGITGVFEREYGGYASAFLGSADRADLRRLTDAFGSEWRLGSIGVKYHACMIGLHSTIDGLLDLKREHDIDEQQIESIQIGLSGSVHRRVAFELPDEPSEMAAQMNVAYVAAVALLDGQVWLEQFSQARRGADDVLSLRAKVDAVHDRAIDARGAAARMSAELTVTLRDGRMLRLSSPAPTARAEGLDEERLVEKFRSLAAPSIGATHADAIVDEVLTLDVAGDVGVLRTLLA